VQVVAGQDGALTRSRCEARALRRRRGVQSPASEGTPSEARVTELLRGERRHGSRRVQLRTLARSRPP